MSASPTASRRRIAASRARRCAIYIGLDPRLTRAAGLSVLAHLEDLVARRLVATDGAPSIEGRYRLS